MKESSKEEEELLFKDLSQRLLYKVKCNVYGRIGTLTGLNDYGAEIDYGNGEDTTCEIKYCLPYLRPMSSMTEEERKEYNDIVKNIIDFIDCPKSDSICLLITLIDWLNAHHFDFRNLIERGLAIDCTGLHIYD